MAGFSYTHTGNGGVLRSRFSGAPLKFDEGEASKTDLLLTASFEFSGAFCRSLFSLIVHLSTWRKGRRWLLNSLEVWLCPRCWETACQADGPQHAPGMALKPCAINKTLSHGILANNLQRNPAKRPLLGLSLSGWGSRASDLRGISDQEKHFFQFQGFPIVWELAGGGSFIAFIVLLSRIYLPGTPPVGLVS